MALLAKQGWRLLQNRDSLFHKIYCARYFSNGNLLEAHLRNSPSFAWRGIWEAKNMLLKGGRWNVGNGRKIHILDDVWLPGFRELRKEIALQDPQQAGRTEELEGQVVSLIDNQTKWWNMPKVRSLFNPKISEAILRQHPSYTDEEDICIWKHERSGYFSVKSAYRLFKSLSAVNVAESSDGVATKKFWNGLWKLKIPHKVKLFAWRACKEILPTKVNLLSKRVEVDGACSFCQHSLEDSAHALNFCPSIHDHWMRKFPNFQLLIPFYSFMTTARRVFLEKSIEEFADFIHMAWGFWYRRNKMIHELVNLPPVQVMNFLLSKKRVQSDGLQAHGLSKRMIYRWYPPPSNWVKLNCDGALFFDQNKIGIGAILRDAQGSVIMALSKGEEEFLEPEIVEAMAVLRGLQICLNIGFKNLVIESDCKNLVDEVNSEEASYNAMRTILTEIQRLMLRFEQCKIQHCGRLSNAAAPSSTCME